MSEHPKVDLDALRENANQIPMYRLIGMQVVEARPGYSKFRLPFREELTQPMGVMHGGAFAAVADSAVAIALWGLVGMDKIFTTIEMKNPMAPMSKMPRAAAWAIILNSFFVGFLIMTTTLPHLAINSLNFVHIFIQQILSLVR